MANGLVIKVIVGADRIVRTGHVFNKIGTYQIAILAKQHEIPFYVAAPLSTFDMTPPELITGIITEKGVAKPPYEESIKKLFEAN